MRAVLALIVVGCAGAPRHLEAPVVDVAAVEGVRARAALVVELALLVDNPNPRPLRARALDWELRAGGLPQVRGRAEVDALVPPGRSVRLDVDCFVGPGATARLLPLLAGGVLEVNGVLHLDAAYGRVEWRGPLRVR